jgi:hypothetical protein
MTTQTPTAKTAATAQLERRPLPSLRRDRTPAGLAALGDPFAALVTACDERFAAAVKERSALDRAEREIDTAIARDREAFRRAALDGKSDPGRRHELKATADLEGAYTAALGATDLANEAARDLFASIDGANGDAVIGEVEQRVTLAREQLAEHLSTVEGDLAEIRALVDIAEGIERARKHGQARSAWASRRQDPLVHARPATPTLLVDTLRAFGEPS